MMETLVKVLGMLDLKFIEFLLRLETKTLVIKIES